MNVTLCEGDLLDTYLLVAENGKSVLIQTDFDYPGTASSFGWSPCDCGATDGTVDCPHKSASEMIAEAGNYLDEHIGEEIEDPGYFLED